MTLLYNLLAFSVYIGDDGSNYKTSSESGNVGNPYRNWATISNECGSNKTFTTDLATIVTLIKPM